MAQAISVEAQTVPDRTIRVGPFELDTQSAELCRDGKRVRLADQPFQILMQLLEHRGQVVTREELQTQLWPGDTFVDFDRSLNSAVRKLRDALGDSAESPRFIETLPRRGYRWIGAPESHFLKKRWPIVAVLAMVLGAGAVVVAIQFSARPLRPEPRPGSRTRGQVDPKAYDFFLRATTALGREKASAIDEAITDLRQAVRIQPDFAPAYAWLALAYTQKTWNGTVAPHELMGRAKAAAQEAVTLDPRLPVGHQALGRVLYQYDWDWLASEQEFRKALALNPSDPSTHAAYATLLRIVGRTKEAQDESQRARELNPLAEKGPEAILNSGVALRAAGMYPEAIATMQKVIQMDPSFRRAYFQLGWTLVEAGHLRDGIAELERAVELTNNANVRFRARLAWAYALAGDEAEARRILDDLRTRSSRSYVAPTSLAIVLVALHDNEHALDQLENAARVRDFDLVTLSKDKTFDPLFGEARFRELMRAIKLPVRSAPNRPPETRN